MCFIFDFRFRQIFPIWFNDFVCTAFVLLLWCAFCMNVKWNWREEEPQQWSTSSKLITFFIFLFFFFPFIVCSLYRSVDCKALLICLQWNLLQFHLLFVPSHPFMSIRVFGIHQNECIIKCYHYIALDSCDFIFMRVFNEGNIPKRSAFLFFFFLFSFSISFRRKDKSQMCRLNFSGFDRLFEAWNDFPFSTSLINTRNQWKSTLVRSHFLLLSIHRFDFILLLFFAVV